MVPRPQNKGTGTCVRAEPAAVSPVPPRSRWGCHTPAAPGKAPSPSWWHWGGGTPGVLVGTPTVTLVWGCSPPGTGIPLIWGHLGAVGHLPKGNSVVQPSHKLIHQHQWPYWDVLGDRGSALLGFGGLEAGLLLPNPAIPIPPS